MSSLAMTIIEALKRENIRISAGRRWLVWDNHNTEWIIYEQKAHQQPKVYETTPDEQRAIYFLLE